MHSWQYQEPDREHFLQIDQHNWHGTKKLDNFLHHRISSTHVHLRHRSNRHPLGPLPSWIARAVIYPEIFARTMAAILDCPEIFAGRMAAILDLRVHDSNESPTNAPHFLRTGTTKRANPPPTWDSRAANKVLNAHQSPTYHGVWWGSVFTLTGA